MHRRPIIKFLPGLEPIGSEAAARRVRQPTRWATASAGSMLGVTPGQQPLHGFLVYRITNPNGSTTI